MTLYDYEYMPEVDKIQWLDSFKILSGLRYFGGKAFIGRYIANHILNMAVKMKQDGHKADIFIDAFAGGGKIALSMPVGWFDKIVLNDFNYGVYSFFNCCKNEPEELVKMIEELGSVMSEQFFKFCARNRSKRDKVKPLVAAAMTYWVTQTSFNGTTDPDIASYRLGMRDNKSSMPTRANEREDIDKIVRHARKHIRFVHDRMIKLNIIVENLDYRELIRKYNGKTYWDTSKLRDGVLDKYKNEKEDKHLDYAELEEIYRKHLDGQVEAEVKYQENNKLWYFDPPYHPATLCGGKDAPYEDTFNIELAREMARILHGDYANIYGELQYFIKSDYSPRVLMQQYKEEYKDAIRKATKGTPREIKLKYTEIYNSRKDDMKKLREYAHDFDILEENVEWFRHSANKMNPKFYRVLVGEFDKGSLDKENRTTGKGREYIWCRGNYIKGMVSD